MKSAYMIIAHDNFQVLQLLLDVLDSKEVDFYLHIDAKVDYIPDLIVREAGLYILKDRVDVKWGDVSQIKTELILWETAYGRGPYRYYHLISGTHFPLKPIRNIASYFNNLDNKNIFAPMYTDEYEIDFKIRRINIFTSSLKHNNISQFCWRAFHKIQKMVGFKKYSSYSFYKASNWCSLTEEAVQYILAHKIQLIKTYKYSFCGDEYFAITALLQSELRETIEFRDDYLKVDFCGSNPKIYGVRDFDNLVNSDCIFARKFSDTDIQHIADRYNKVKNN